MNSTDRPEMQMKENKKLRKNGVVQKWPEKTRNRLRTLKDLFLERSIHSIKMIIEKNKRKIISKFIPILNKNI